ncbi:hypothetical protein GCM10010483_56310 [Actinokineospora diospyrosa]
MVLSTNRANEVRPPEMANRTPIPKSFNQALTGPPLPLDNLCGPTRHPRPRTREPRGSPRTGQRLVG